MVIGNIQSLDISSFGDNASFGLKVLKVPLQIVLVSVQLMVLDVLSLDLSSGD